MGEARARAIHGLGWPGLVLASADQLRAWRVANPKGDAWKQKVGSRVGGDGRVTYQTLSTGQRIRVRPLKVNGTAARRARAKARRTREVAGGRRHEREGATHGSHD